MTAMHLVRTVLVALANPKSFAGGLYMQRRGDGGGEAKAWRRSFDVAFVDPSGWLNLAASLSKSALAQARDAATRSLALLNTGTPEAFDAVFLCRRRQAALCDYWFHVRAPPLAPDADGYSRELLRDQPSWRCVRGRVTVLVCFMHCLWLLSRGHARCRCRIVGFWSRCGALSSFIVFQCQADGCVFLCLYERPTLPPLLMAIGHWSSRWSPWLPRRSAAVRAWFAASAAPCPPRPAVQAPRHSSAARCDQTKTMCCSACR